MIRRIADGEGKFVSLLKLTELSDPMDLAELNPLDDEVLFPRPRLTSRKGGGGGATPVPPEVIPEANRFSID